MKDYSLRIEDDLLKKLHFVAKYNGRSANKEIIRIIQEHVEEFELRQGTIKISDD